jgi:2-(3-amino-3-carboxypropyl)histidine synthase
VIIADPDMNEVRDITEKRDKVLRQRHAAIEAARKSKNIGILISRKAGQKREREALRVAQMMSDAGFETTAVEMDLVTQNKLDSFGLGAWVSTACPRLAIDDAASFSVPLLTVTEAEILAGKRAWDNYVFDEIV